MNREDLYESIGGVNDSALVRSEKTPAKKRRPKGMAALAALLVLALAVGLIFQPFGGSRAYAISEAVYPEQVKRPGSFALNRDEKMDAWRDYRDGRALPEGSAEAMRPFLEDTFAAFLSGGGEENQLCSPVNLYMALAMLTELTAGESQSQLLEALGSDSPERVRKQANQIFRALYREERKCAAVLGNSIWLSREIDFDPQVMDTLSTEYFASSYHGSMGSRGFDRAMQSWLNDQTGGRLENRTGRLETNPETMFVLLSTLYCHEKWSEEFKESETRPGTFHAPGGDLTCDFMHERTDGDYYWGDKFGAVQKGFDKMGTLWMILPDEGVSVDELLQDAEARAFLSDPDKFQTWEDQRKTVYVNLALPKFDVTANLDLREGLSQMGVSDVFDPALADFSPMLTERGAQQLPALWLDEAQQELRVEVDEEGIRAAAYIELMGCGASAPPEDEIDFVLDRPFLFVYTEYESGLPLFAGVINQP